MKSQDHLEMFYDSKLIMGYLSQLLVSPIFIPETITLTEG